MSGRIMLSRAPGRLNLRLVAIGSLAVFWLPHQNNTTAAPFGALSGGMGGGPQTREQWSARPLSGRHRCIRTLRTPPGPAWRDKSLKSRGFETPRADDQGGALRRLQSRAGER